MSFAALFHLPSDVQRLDPVLRRISGGCALLGSARVLPARFDSRELTRQALRRRGWAPLDEPRPSFDLILTTSNAPLQTAESWLAPSGRLVVFHESHARTPLVVQVPVALDAAGRIVHGSVGADRVSCICVADGALAVTVNADHVRVTGDPRLDSAFDIGSAARARAALGVESESKLLLVSVDETVCRNRWPAALAQLRHEYEVVLMPTFESWLKASPWPRELTGPGLHIAPPDGSVELADLLMAADVVVTAPGEVMNCAQRLHRSIVGIRKPQAQSWPHAAQSVCAAEDLAPCVAEYMHASFERHAATNGNRSATRVAAVIAELL